MDQLSFAGCEASKIIPWGDLFEEYYNDDGELHLVSKKTYTHEDPDFKTFTYQYVLKAIDVGRQTGEEPDRYVQISLYLVPEPKYWAGEALESIAYAYGLEGHTDDEIRDVLSVTDALSSHLAVCFGFEDVEYTQEDGYYDVLDAPGVETMLDAAASVLDWLDSMRGERIDGAWNQIGSTGWDILEYAFGGADPVLKKFGKTAKRYEVRTIPGTHLWMAYDNNTKKAAIFPGDNWAVVSGNKKDVEAWVSGMNADNGIADPRILSVSGPDGNTMTAKYTQDCEYPGIAVSVSSPKQAEVAAAMVEYHNVRNCYRACAWTEDDIEYGQDPSGDINLTESRKEE